MSTTGTTSFNLDVNDLIEEAFERCGKELRTGYDFRTARRSMNLLTIEWANRGINLWTIEEGSIPLVQGQITYALPDNTIDLLDQITRTGSGLNQQDLNINRISETTYSTIPNKNTTGRPIQVWINRQSGQNNTTVAELAATITSTATTITLDDVTMLGSAGFIKLDNEIISYSNLVKSSTSSAGTLSNCGRAQQNTLAAAHTVGAAVTVVNPPSINVWPTPDQGSQAQPYYTFVYWRMRRVQDAGTGVSTQDIPFRFITCMVAGLAYYLAMKLPDVPMDRAMGLKQEYEQQFQLAAEEDREKANVRFVPRSMNYYR
jgi:hypothetical protein